MIKVYVDVVPMVAGHTHYVAKVWDKEDMLFQLESSESLRKLMTSLQEKAEENQWKKDNIKILGEFNDNDLTEDDVLVWETPIEQLELIN